MTRLLAWLLEPDRLYRMLGYASLALALALLAVALVGGGTVYWRRWEAY